VWLFLPLGFLSAVAHRDSPDLVLVRAREPEILDYMTGTLISLGRQVVRPRWEDHRADYPYRVLVDRQAWATFLAYEGQRIEATNFKSHAAHSGASRDFLAACHDVWEALNRRLAHRRPEVQIDPRDRLELPPPGELPDWHDWTDADLPPLADEDPDHD